MLQLLRLSAAVTPIGGEGTANIPSGFYLIYLLMLLVSLVPYIFTSLGFHAIARRRGIAKPWLSWIPIGQLWIMGSISDQYQLMTRYRTTNKRKALLWLQVVLIALFAMMLVLMAVTVLSAMDVAQQGNQFPFVDVWQPVRENVREMVVLYVVLLVVAIVTAVVQYVALFDLYQSSDPENAVLFLVLSILVNITMPFLVFSVRGKDLGMEPPQRPGVPGKH